MLFLVSSGLNILLREERNGNVPDKSDCDSTPDDWPDEFSPDIIDEPLLF
ncbi:hypothetical protein FACS1894122_02030 [Alphaproteobacteria bacterium]|nr:hypothetical protein FACS1894122_02030 [Alphaproteobacteria bacterium]